MKYGLKTETRKAIQKAILQIKDIEKVVLYGSRAKGNYSNGSDIDITLFGHDLTLDNSVYPLMGALDDLYLPYSFDISIHSQINNPDLIEHIEKIGKVFCERDNGIKP